MKRDRTIKFLPYEHLRIHTKLSKDVVLRQLEYVIEPKRYFRFFGSGSKPYQGSREGSHFEISRITGYRNSLMPVIKGDVQNENSGCSISITMHPHFLVTAFMTFWLGGVGYFFLVVLYAVISSLFTERGATNPLALLWPAGMFVLGYGLFLGAFKFESVKSKKYFQELFEAREVEEFGITHSLEKVG